MTDHITLPRSVVEQKHYADRDIMDMDKAGGYYIRHVSAMTGEALHSKSDIAAELGWRDMEIDRLRAALAAQQAEPVAWMFEFPDKRVAPKFDTLQHGGNWKPLYAAPQPAQPVAVPQGWKLVPVEPTPEMCRALFINLTHADDETRLIKAVLAAAPTPPAATVPQGHMAVSVDTLAAAVNPDAGNLEWAYGSYSRQITICHGCGLQTDGWVEESAQHRDGCALVAQLDAQKEIRELLAAHNAKLAKKATP